MTHRIRLDTVVNIIFIVINIFFYFWHFELYLSLILDLLWENTMGPMIPITILALSRHYFLIGRYDIDTTYTQHFIIL